MATVQIKALDIVVQETVFDTEAEAVDAAEAMISEGTHVIWPWQYDEQTETWSCDAHGLTIQIIEE